MCVREAEERLDALLLSPASVAVACSGGSDSMALVLIAQGWAKKRGIELVALTVDHGLRKEAAQEAKQVAKWLKARGITHHILAWEGKKPKNNIQEAARKARYRLMGDYCREHGMGALLLAHTLDDQAETFMLRLRRGSGIDGLASMAEVAEVEGAPIVRPLLALQKSQLVAYLKKQKQDFVHDPSNDNEDYDRVKIRKLIPALIEVGLTPQRIALAANNMARAKNHLKKETENFLAGHCDFHAMGYAILRSLPDSDEIALRALGDLLRTVGGQTTPLRLEALTRLYEELLAPGFKGATVAGCKIQPTKAKTLLIFRELAAVQAPVTLKPGETTVWDTRFEVTLEKSRGALQLGALTQEGWLEVEKQYGLKNPCPDKKILYTLPALRSKDGRLAAVPHLGVSEKSVACRVQCLSYRKRSGSGARSSS